MKIVAAPIKGVVVIETTPVTDARGSFARLFCERDLAVIVGARRIVQINHSDTAKVGAVRGMHFQRPPQAEMKFVRCVRGRVWDVALDLRTGSPSFLQWHATELTPENALMQVIPEGCAHGFQALEAHSELIYLHTSFYAPDAEGGVSPLDARVGIAWPLAVADLSRRDAGHRPLDADFTGIAV